MRPNGFGGLGYTSEPINAAAYIHTELSHVIERYFHAVWHALGNGRCVQRHVHNHQLAKIAVGILAPDAEHFNLYRVITLTPYMENKGFGHAAVAIVL